jgi:hypothetical protein
MSYPSWRAGYPIGRAPQGASLRDSFLTRPTASTVTVRKPTKIHFDNAEKRRDSAFDLKDLYTKSD